MSVIILNINIQQIPIKRLDYQNSLFLSNNTKDLHTP